MIVIEGGTLKFDTKCSSPAFFDATSLDFFRKMPTDFFSVYRDNLRENVRHDFHDAAALHKQSTLPLK
jgi:NAD-dependent SIR2 family protein deacetylase